MAAPVKRPSKDEYYLGIADKISERSTCLRRRFGAIIIKDDSPVSQGYNGAPRGVKDCLEEGYCFRKEKNIPSGERYELCRSVHAEDNAIINAARLGTSILKGTMYIHGRDADTGKSFPGKPCEMCKRKIINSGLEKIVFIDEKNTIVKMSVEELLKTTFKNFNTTD
ncbi:MAG: deaminase [archaeon]